VSKTDHALRSIYSVFREISAQTHADILDIDTTEEELVLRPMVYLDDNGSVSPLETYSEALQRKVGPEKIWNLPIAVSPDRDYGTKVELTDFLDGIQRTSCICSIPVLTTGERVPLSIGQTAAAILNRDGRRIRAAHKFVRRKLCVLFPMEFVAERTNLDNIRDWAKGAKPSVGGLEWCDTSYDPAPVREGNKVVRNQDGSEKHDRLQSSELARNLTDMNWFRNLARRWNRRHRAIMEQNIHDTVAAVRASEPTKAGLMRFLVIDGTITDVRGKVLNYALGISKSFNTRFLGQRQHNKVLQLQEWQRSPVFLLGDPPDESSLVSGTSVQDLVRFSGKRASWYARLRVIKHGPPTQGLVRIEVMPEVLPNKGSADRWGQEDSLVIDAITQAVLRERIPTSLPDKRWHNLIYPIHMCEEYLRSMVFPHETIRHLAVAPGVQR
jgi:hypothetical protein